MWLSDQSVPANVSEAIAERYEVRHLSLNDSLARHAEGAQAALIYAGEPASNIRRVSLLLDELERTSLVGLLLLGEQDLRLESVVGGHGRFAVAAAEAPPEVIATQLSAILQLRPAVEALQKEVSRIRTLGTDIGRTLGEIDEEMRLAARLQRDFLPSTLPQVGPLRFSVMFRPASWVSGDIYSVDRLDERNVGFYVADAVGHGLPAALLTMFIKRALPTKHVSGHQYEIVRPDHAITELNQAICQQGLSSCQFCSATYCIVDSESLEMTYARGGHPEAIHLHADGRTTDLQCPGGLLGIFPDESYALARAQLAPGDRVLLHTDGAEELFRCPGSCGRDEFVTIVEKCRHLQPDEMILQLTAEIDNMQGSLHPEDDITLIVLDVAG